MARNVVAGLIRGGKYHSRFIKQRNLALVQNLTPPESYDVIFFHETDLTDDQMTGIRKTIPHAQFIDVTERFNEVLYQGEQRGYKHMCRFYSTTVFEILADYDYYLRLDDDSILKTPPPRNLFEVMEENHYWFGYRACSQAEVHVPTIKTLPRFVEDHIETYDLKRPWGFRPDTSNFYSNFELSALDFWKKKEVWQLLQAIDKDGGIYRHRWGDSPIHGYCVRLFCPPERLWGFDDFIYFHGSLNDCFNINEQVLENLPGID